MSGLLLTILPFALLQTATSIILEPAHVALVISLITLAMTTFNNVKKASKDRVTDAEARIHSLESEITKLRGLLEIRDARIEELTKENVSLLRRIVTRDARDTGPVN